MTQREAAPRQAEDNGQRIAEAAEKVLAAAHQESRELIQYLRQTICLRVVTRG